MNIISPLFLLLFVVNVLQCKLTIFGEEYKGWKNSTKSGTTCQAWKSQTPNKHEYSNLANYENYCRNPDKTTSGPWCLLANDDVKRWEDCNVPLCGNSYLKKLIIVTKNKIKETSHF